jgi:Fic family protein
MTTSQPERLPIRKLKKKGLEPLILEAYLTLGKFKGLLESVDHPEKVLFILNLQESFYSLKAQKIQGPFAKAAKYFRSGVQPPPDVQTVFDYYSALIWAKNTLKKHSFSIKLIQQIHGKIKKNSEGFAHEIGRFRKRQNWIGAEGCKMEDAYYYPPKAALVPSLMRNFKKHLDGNGRVDRLLIPLFLYKKDLLPHPLFFMSRFFYEHRQLYLQKLFNISAKGQWEKWICFFLKAVIKQGEQNCAQVRKISALHQAIRQTLLGKEKGKKIERILITLFKKPLFTLEEWQTETGLSTSKARESLKLLERLRIIEKKGKAHKTYWKFSELLKILNNP